MARNRIIIYCDNASDKHGKKHPNPIVHGFRYDESHADGTGQGWLDNIRSKRLRDDKAHDGAAHQLLVDNEKYNTRKFTIDNRDEWADRLRESWDLPCHKCGYSILVVDKKLYSVLHRMRENGIDRIGLLSLERILLGSSK